MNNQSNTKSIVFWTVFVLVLALIVWGLAVAMKKSANNPNGSVLKSPAPISANDHTLGASTSPVTLIEYSDFQCPACHSYYPVVTKLLSEMGTSTYFVYRHFPLGQHPNAIPAAIASEAASEQGKFWDMYNILFTEYDDWVNLPDPTSVFIGYATKAGLNVSKFTNDLSSTTLRDKVAAERDEGIDIGINSTPTFFVNGKVIKTPSSYDEFKTIIQSAASGSTI
jgi:protein-disulfide isomerase